MNFGLMIRHITQMILGQWLRVQMIHFAQFCGKRTRLRLVINEITARASRDYGSSSTRLRLIIMMLLLMVVGVNTAWGQTEEKPADLKAGGCSETWLRIMETEALPSITSAKVNILFETAK